MLLEEQNHQPNTNNDNNNNNASHTRPGAGCCCITHVLKGKGRRSYSGRYYDTTRYTSHANAPLASRKSLTLHLLCVSVCFCSAKGVGVSAWFCLPRGHLFLMFGRKTIMRWLMCM